MLTQLVEGRYSEGNEVSLFTSGDDAFEAAYEAISRAQARVWLETYIFEPDEVGTLAVEALTEAAQRGCEVLLLYDRWGSPRLRTRHLTSLVEAGGRVAVYNPFFPWRKFGRKITSFLHRDHRKILVADDRGFCGGHNISTEYGGPGPERFFDVAVCLEGPCVADLSAVFLESFVAATKLSPEPPARTPALPGGVPASVLTLNTHRRDDTFNQAIKQFLSSARSHCFLSTPYFVPPAWVLRLLVETAQRGVDVRLLTAGLSDVPAARLAGRHVYGDLLAAGIRIYELLYPTLHAKFMTIDHGVSVIGSYNIDAYGSKHNREVGVAVVDAALAHALEQVFSDTLPRAEEVQREAWRHRSMRSRFIAWLLYRLGHL